jgi:hypothetical protein
MPSTVSAMGRTAMRLAYKLLVIAPKSAFGDDTYVFDVRARVDGNHVAVLNPQVVANDSVYPR